MTAPEGGSIDVATVSRNQLEPVFAIDAEGRVAFANDRFLAVSGRSPETTIGEDYEVFSGIVETGFEGFRAAVDAVLRGDSPEERIELSMYHPEGAPVARRLPAEARVTPIDRDGSFLGVLVALRQITTRKAQERRLKRQNERLEEFAGVVSHDLRNPLNVAEGHLALAREVCDSPHLDEIERAMDRMDAIVEDTLTLAKQGQHVGEPDRVSLAELVRQCWATVGTAGASLDVVESATIVADPNRLRNLFENLFRNAVDHGGESVTVRVGVLDGGFFVEDDGPGIAPDDRERVFDLGYSTAEGGTGYGLAIVGWILEAHGWDVSVMAARDGGVRFEFSGVETVT